MFYMQEKVVHSIHQERHREAEAERLSGQSRLPARIRERRWPIPQFSTRSARSSAAATSRPVA
jgi:hypothetical protein